MRAMTTRISTAAPHQVRSLVELPDHPGWYRDPLDPDRYPYWDGARWTGRTVDRTSATRKVRAWYLLGCVLPYALSFVLPLAFGLAARGAWTPADAERVIAAGWWPWLVGTMGSVVLAGVAAEFRHGDTAGARGWNAAAVTAAILVGGVGLVASGLIEVLMQIGSVTP